MVGGGGGSGGMLIDAVDHHLGLEPCLDDLNEGRGRRDFFCNASLCLRVQLKRRQD